MVYPLVGSPKDSSPAVIPRGSISQVRARTVAVRTIGYVTGSTGLDVEIYVRVCLWYEDVDVSEEKDSGDECGWATGSSSVSESSCGLPYT